MSKSLRIPSLRRHKPSAQGVVTLAGRDHYLGRWPASSVDVPSEVQERYDQLIAEWLANGRRSPANNSGQESITINELILAFWRHAAQHYRHADRSTTDELRQFQITLRSLRGLYGRSDVQSFGPLRLKALRQTMIEKGLCRGVINQRVARVVRVFKWGIGEELVPETVWRALTAVKGLAKGRTQAREATPIKPVADAIVDTLIRKTNLVRRQG